MTILGAGGDAVRVLQRDADDELAGPVPQIGEPEDVIDEVPLLKSKTGIGPYYQIIPRKEPDDRQTADRRQVCWMSASILGYPSRDIFYHL
jgi:hypothetical protein